MGGPANNFFLYRAPRELSNSSLRSTNKKKNVQRQHNSNSQASLFQRSRAWVAATNTKRESLRKSVHTKYQTLVRPNQSLKLTETAVDDFARAKQSATIGRDMPRADSIPLRRLFAAAA